MSCLIQAKTFLLDSGKTKYRALRAILEEGVDQNA